MDAALHDDLGRFADLTRPLLEADPVRNTVALSAIAMRLRVPDAAEEPPVLLTVHDGDRLLGAALATPPRGLIVSALPGRCAAAAADVLADVGVSDVVGPRPEVESFARAWSYRTGAVAHERMAQRLFVLGRLCPPVAVTGVPRLAGSGDVALLARWRTAFAGEATGGLRSAGSAADQTRRSLAAGNASLLWEVGGSPVAWAAASAPVTGMSRIGPVYTDLGHRSRGYGSAVTAAATAWAQQAGARHVVLLTDLSNPISNTIYPRLGFRPVHDAVEIEFGARGDG